MEYIYINMEQYDVDIYTVGNLNNTTIAYTILW